MFFGSMFVFMRQKPIVSSLLVLSKIPGSILSITFYRVIVIN